MENCVKLFFEDKLKDRMYKRLKGIGFDLALMLNFSGYYVAGGACNKGQYNDIDIYPANKDGFNFEQIKLKVNESLYGAVSLVHESSKTLTVKIVDGSDERIVQLCNYVKGSLKQLVESFDFAHCKIGVYVDPIIDGESGSLTYTNIEIKDCHISDAWFIAAADDSSFYALMPDESANGYPLSSLIRLFKYRKRDIITNAKCKTTVLQILEAIVNRGFKNYEDFKDQLEAIDLNMDEDNEYARSLFETLKNKGLVWEE